MEIVAEGFLLIVLRFRGRTSTMTSDLPIVLQFLKCNTLTGAMNTLPPQPSQSRAVGKTAAPPPPLNLNHQPHCEAASD